LGILFGGKTTITSLLYSAAKLLVSTAQFVIQDVPHAFSNALDTYQFVDPTPRWTGREKAKHVIFVNLDAISPQQFGEIRANSPIIDEAIRGGSISYRMLGAFPAQTSTIHASALTGEYPERHGVYVVHEHSLDDILLGDQCAPVVNPAVNNRSHCRGLKLTDAAFRSGLTTASFGYGTTHGDPHIHYNIGDITCTRDAGIVGGICKKMSTVFSLKHMIPALFHQLFGSALSDSLQVLASRFLDDSFVSAAEDVILHHKANLVCVQQEGYDITAHCFGTQAAEAVSFLTSYRNNLERIIRASQMAGTYEDTVFSLMSDHLIFDVDTYVYLNNLFWKNGLIQVAGKKIISCDAYGESVGKSFLIHIVDNKKSTKSRVVQLLRQNQEEFGIERIFGRRELDGLHAGMQYDLACTARPGVRFMHTLTSTRNVRSVMALDLRGHHGHDPRGNQTIFAIWGPGIKKGYDIGDMEVVDIAPTLGHVLGLDFSCSGGKVLDVFED
jgi:predicted AlkP superfamily pyrophosphatase or phosphodiesterase